MFNNEWGKITADSEGLCSWEDVWEKSLRDGKANGMISDG
jgi:hypothetical protein